MTGLMRIVVSGRWDVPILIPERPLDNYVGDGVYYWRRLLLLLL